MPLRALSLFILLLAAACTADDPSEKLQIAVIPKGTTHEFWKSVHAGAETAAQELGVEVIWKGPLIESDRNAQIQVVEDFVKPATRVFRNARSPCSRNTNARSWPWILERAGETRLGRRSTKDLAWLTCS